MIPMTRKQFNITLLAIFAVVFIVGIVGFIKYTNYKKSQEPTPEEVADLAQWHSVADATRRLIDDEPLWRASEQEAALIASAIQKGMEFNVFAYYLIDGDELVDSYIYGGSIPGIEKNVNRETARYKLAHSIAASMVSSQYRKAGRKVELASVSLSWADADGEHELVDADADGAWDEDVKPSN